MDIQALLNRIDETKALIDSHRPLRPEEAKELDAYFRIGTTYSSNALEGNSLTLTETKVLLEDGLTAGGKPLRDCYEAVGHAKAYDFMLETARGDLGFSEDLILRLHGLFYLRLEPEMAGVYRDRQVFITGTEFVPPPAEKVPELMRAFVGELNDVRECAHPVVLAAFAHRKLAGIHPFIDGNGRTARLLMNLILVNSGYQIAIIPPILRGAYINALKMTTRRHNPSDEAFVRLVAECEIETQSDYCRLLGIRPSEKSD
ncbi:MAG: Fic family protein [Deltaproteobacteria bacterium]|jgi:Fic family protein|nr:Fic family protein [Deltaproteobacteria bacterium]